MEDGNGMLKNALMLKKCRKIDNAITLIYAGMCGICIIISFFLFLISLISKPGESLSILADGIVIKAAVFVGGFCVVYKHETNFVFFALTAVTVGALLNPANFLVAFVVILLSCLTAYNNKNYHYLETQEGFPAFSERFEEQKKESARDSFRQSYENYLKTSSDDMQEIDVGKKSTDLNENKSDNGGQMESV